MRKESVLLLVPALLFPAFLVAQEAVHCDHGTFDGLLSAHLSQAGLVDYDAFVGNSEFQDYLADLAHVRLESLPEAERLAFWINAYNAYPIELINRHEERKSIRNINKTLGFLSGRAPWNERMAEVAGDTRTLDEIEHEIIWEQFRELRIHFALVCVAVGCPS